MPRITPIPTTRVSDTLAQQRLLSQLQSDQIDVLRLQQQIATGRRIQVLSEDAPAGLRGVTLQRLLEQKQQIGTNLRINQSFLVATDEALSGISGELAKARAGALGVTGAVATDTEREAVALELDGALQDLLNTANQVSAGRYLFAGSRTAQLPFEQRGNYIRYNGNENHLQSYGDIDLLVNTNVTGDEGFGALSKAVVGTTDLNPVLTAQTKLSDLNNGNGVSVGSIEISDGTNSSIIDLNTAHTLGDVVALIEANPPTGRTLTVEITPTGLTLSLDAAVGGNLRIKEVGGGTSARDLGILAESFVGTGPIVGGNLDPRLQLTTRLSDAFGARSYALLDSAGGDNSLRIEAITRGAALNGYTITFVDNVPSSGVVVNPTGPTSFEVEIDSGASTGIQVRDALNAHAGFNANFTVTLDTTLDPENDGSGTVVTSTTGTTAHGSGVEFDQTSGLQILNGDVVHTIDLSAAVTVEDLLNTLNGSEADVLAQLNADGRTISIRSRLSGADFAIGENGGDTATHLGLRSFTAATKLADLNHGLGIHPNETGDDFIIRRKDGVDLRFDLSPASSPPASVGDVINLINNHPDNQLAATRVVARLAVDGNGIELVDDGLANGQLTVLKVNNSQAAEDLGLIPVGQSSVTTSPAASATATLTPGGVNNDILFTANLSGPQRNGVQIEFLDDAAVGLESVEPFDPVTNTLTIHYHSASSTAGAIAALVTAEGTFEATLDTSVDPANDGSGLIGALPPPAALTTAGGTSQVLTGRDTNPQEVKGVFNSLIRLRNALRANDEVQTDRAVALVETDLTNVNFVRAEIGARQQGVEVLQTRLADETINLESALADEIEVDFATAISNLLTRQASLQASLQMTAQLSRLTLLDFL
ncbi:MAG: flagellin [Pirellulales bacterium]